MAGPSAFREGAVGTHHVSTCARRSCCCYLTARGGLRPPRRSISMARDSACASLSVREKLFVVTMCVLLVVMTSNYATMVTFFPMYAASHGVSTYGVSMIFTAFSIGNLLVSLVAGQLASCIGRRAVLCWGVCQVSASGIFIGCTPELAGGDATLMVLLFTAARGLQGGGVALARLSMFASLSDDFPENRGLVLGSATSMIALGYMLGPPVGGLLFTLSGFRMPFMFLSALVLICAVPLLSMWPSAGAAAERSTQGLAAADSAAAADPSALWTGLDESSTGLPRGSLGDAAKERQMPPDGTRPQPEVAAVAACGRRPSTRELLCLLPLDVYVVALTAFIFESKWAWWDIYVTSIFFIGEFELSLPTASLHISLVATAFAIGCPLGGSLGDRLGERRIPLVVTLMVALGAVYVAMGPWQLALLVPLARRVVLYFYLIADGSMGSLLEPQLVPQMLHLAEQQSRASGGEGRNEHLTNFVTSLGQFMMNAGAVFGPFVAVPLIEAYGFRGALSAWGAVFVLVAALTAIRVRSRLSPMRPCRAAVHVTTELSTADKVCEPAGQPRCEQGEA